MIYLTRITVSFVSAVFFMGILWTPGYAGELYAINDDPSFPGQNPLISIDTTTFAITTIGDLGIPFTSGGLAYDPNSDILYLVDGLSGTVANGLYTVDRSTGVATLLGIHGVTDLLGLAFDSTNNILYASSYDGNTNSGAFYTLDTGTGAATLVGNTRGYSGLAYNSNLDQLLGTQGTTFYIIDPSTGGSDQALADFGVGQRNGLAYDSDLDRWWQSTSDGDLFSYDPALGFQSQHIFGGSMAPRLDSLAYVANPIIEPLIIDITRARVSFGADAGGFDDVRVRGRFTLSLGSNGIDPVTEGVRVTVGTATLIIPPDSFIPVGAKFLFEGHVGPSVVKMKIGGNSGEISFLIAAQGVDLTDTSNPINISLHIGDDAGETSVRMQGNLRSGGQD